MSETDTVIAALRREHDQLTALVGTFTEEDLRRPSGASDWDVSQVLSHLGSAAVINLATLQGALKEAGEPTEPTVIWARWNAMSPRERADEFIAADTALVDRYERLTDAERSELRLEVGFLPFPLTVAMAGRMRLNEIVLHGWDVRVAFDERRGARPRTVAVVLNGEPNLIGWLGKTEVLDGRYARPAGHHQRAVVAVHPAVGRSGGGPAGRRVRSERRDASAPGGGLAPAGRRPAGGRSHPGRDRGHRGRRSGSAPRRVFPGY